ncbi:hypothetical protein AMTRI_Chr04g246150 [Amborella trichopoda]
MRSPPLPLHHITFSERKMSLSHTMTITTLALALLLARAVADDGPLPTPPGFPNPPPSDPYGFNGKFSPSMAVIVVVLISAFFFMAFFSLYIRQCTGDDSTVAPWTGQRNVGGGRSRRSRGLDPAIIETFPTLVYSVVKGLKIGKGTLECAVCLSEFEDDESLRLIPNCSHVFHPECIDEWLASHVTCPLCRANLTVPPPPDTKLPENSPDAAEDPNPPPEDEIPVVEEITITIDPQAPSAPEPQQNRPPKRLNRFLTMKFPRSNKFQRSHSTGHSPVGPDRYERHTLRLPENVRKQIVKGKLNRTISCVAFPTESGSVAGSSHGGRRIGEGSSRGGRSLRRNKPGEGSSRGGGWSFSERWTFSMTPPFLSRALSFGPPRDGAEQSRSNSQAQSLPSYLRIGETKEAALPVRAEP